MAEGEQNAPHSIVVVSPEASGRRVRGWAAASEQTGGLLAMSVGEPTVQWDEVSYVISSGYRTAVLERLSEGPATPSRIAADSDNALAHTSRALQELRERSLVELLVSEERKKGRVYGITEEAESLWEMIETQNMV